MKDKKTYEETHRKLVEAFQEACCSDDFDDYPETPEFDLSFLNEEGE